MDNRRNVEEEKMVAELYEASQNGCVSTLTTLIQRNARFLDRVSLTSFSETPMHYRSGSPQILKEFEALKF
jgi:hypothetical protein